MKKTLILSFLLIFFLGLIVGYIPSLASPGPGAPNPGHTASQIGGDSDAERTFNSTGKYTFLGALDVKGELTVVGNISSINYVRGKGLCIGNDCRTSWPSGISGSGTANYIVKFTSSNTVNPSQIYESGGNIGIGTTSPQAKLHVSGGDIYVDSGKGLRSYTGDLIIDAHSSGTGTVRLWDNLVVSGSGSFNNAEQWSNFVTSRTGYGDTIGIGGDNVGDDLEIRINAPSSRNKVVFWNPTISSSVGIVAQDGEFRGNLYVSGFVKIGGAKLLHVTGSNPSCPSGCMFLSKRYQGSCGGDSGICSQPYITLQCSGCSVDKWDTNPASCVWYGFSGSATCQCSSYHTCQVSTWTEAICVCT